MAKVVETFEELIEVVLEELPDETLLQLRDMKWHKLGDTHFGLGLYLRNEYIHTSFGKLQKNRQTSLYKYPITHADDISGYLIEILWLRLNNRKKPPLANRIREGFVNSIGYILYIVYFKPQIVKEPKERPELERPSDN